MSAFTRAEQLAHYARLSPGAARWAQRALAAVCRQLALDVEDVAQEACAGVWEGIVRWQPGRGATLDTCCYGKARIAALEAVRQWDPRPRSMQDRAKALLRDWEPLPEGLALPLSLDVPCPWLDEEADFWMEMLPDERAEAVEAVALARLESESLHQAVSWLPRREREAMRLLCWEGRTWREIGAALGSKGGGGMVLARAAERLRGYLREEARG